MRCFHKSKIQLALASILFAGSMSLAHAGDADIDVEFGGQNIKDSHKDLSGVITSQLGGTDDYAASFSLDPEGYLLAVGQYFDPVNGTIPYMTRYDVSGSVDLGYGEDGNGFQMIEGVNVAMQDTLMRKDGKLLVLNDDFSITQFKADGSLDKTFGDSGYAHITLDREKRKVSSRFALQNNGSIVVAGTVWDAYSQDAEIGVVRYTEQGKIDLGFGKNGTAIYRQKGEDKGVSIALSLDEQDIVVGGSIKGIPAVVAFNGKGGVGKKFAAIIDSAYGTVSALGIHPMGNKVVAVVVGQKYGSVGIFPVLFNSNGSLDTVFNQTVREAQVVEETGAQMVIQPDGKIVVGATIQKEQPNSEFDTDIILARYNADGNADETFRVDGLVQRMTYPPVTYDFGSYFGSYFGSPSLPGAVGYDFSNLGDEDVLHSLALQDDGKILLGGRLGSSYGVSRIIGSSFSTKPSKIMSYTKQNVGSASTASYTFQNNLPIGKLSNNTMVPFHIRCVGVDSYGAEKPYDGCKYAINNARGTYISGGSWVKNGDKFYVRHTQGSYKTVKSTITIGGIHANNNNQFIMGGTETATFVTNR